VRASFAAAFHLLLLTETHHSIFGNVVILLVSFIYVIVTMSLS